MLFRYYLAFPLTLIAVMLYGSYTMPREWLKKIFGDKSVLYYTTLLFLLPFGLIAGITNLIYNFTVGSFVFGEWPVMKNEKGGFSPFFTTRIKSYLNGTHLIKHIVGMKYAHLVNKVDPGHFDIPKG